MTRTEPQVFGEPQRALAAAALAYLVMNNLVAGLWFIALYGFDLGALADLGSLADRGSANADGLRWASLVDMAGYLALAPVVIGIHDRLRATSAHHPRGWVLSVHASCGLGFVLVGAIGAVLMASVGPGLLDASAEDQTAASARLGFAALANAVIVGLWGTLELSLYGAWIFGVGRLVRSEGRAFAVLAQLAGLGALAYALRTGITGRTPAELSSPLDILIFGGIALGFAWLAWLFARLWTGR